MSFTLKNEKPFSYYMNPIMRASWINKWFLSTNISRDPLNSFYLLNETLISLERPSQNDEMFPFLIVIRRNSQLECNLCRCKQPVSIVVEMDRILRPGGWAIIREKVEILDPLEAILKSLNWEIRMTYSQDKEGILCAQKTMWRP